MNQPRQRAEDNNIFSKISYYKDKLFIFWAPALAFIAAMGFGFQTPAQTASKLQAQITILSSKDSISSIERKNLNFKIDILLRLNCVNGKISPHDLSLVGLDCAKLLNQ